MKKLVNISVPNKRFGILEIAKVIDNCLKEDEYFDGTWLQQIIREYPNMSIVLAESLKYYLEGKE